MFLLWPGDALLQEHNTFKFTTKDKDNDNSGGYNCAKETRGGFWYNKCMTANPTGIYHIGKLSTALALKSQMMHEWWYQCNIVYMHEIQKFFFIVRNYPYFYV